MSTTNAKGLDLRNLRKLLQRLWTTYTDSRHQDVVAAVLGSVVRAPVPVHAPVAGEGRGHALGARDVRVAVEEGEVGRNEVRARRHAHRQFGSEVV